MRFSRAVFGPMCEVSPFVHVDADDFGVETLTSTLRGKPAAGDGVPAGQASKERAARRWILVCVVKNPIADGRRGMETTDFFDDNQMPLAIREHKTRVALPPLPPCL